VYTSGVCVCEINIRSIAGVVDTKNNESCVPREILTTVIRRQEEKPVRLNLCVRVIFHFLGVSNRARATRLLGKNCACVCMYV
jgi:hypothetical protein